MKNDPPAYQISSLWLRWLPVLSVITVGVLTLSIWLNIGIERPFTTFSGKATVFLSWSDIPASGAAGFVHEMHRRLDWELSYVALGTLGFGSVLTGLWIARASLGAEAWRRWLKWGACFLSLALMICVAIVLFPGSSGFQLARELLAYVKDKGGFVGLTFLINSGEFFMVGPPITLAVAAAAILHVPACGTNENSVTVFRMRAADLDLILYVGAALLVAGTLEIRAFYLWGDAYLSQSEGRLYWEAANTISTVAGGFFSFMLALIYLPSAYLLRRFAKGPPEPASAESTSWGNWAASLGRVVAILAPIISGGHVADILKSLS